MPARSAALWPEAVATFSTICRYNYCAKTCDRAPCHVVCSDVQPPTINATCAQQKLWGKCSAGWMKGGGYW